MLAPIDNKDFPSEKDIQTLVEANLETLFGLTFVTSEFSIGGFRLDTLAFDAENEAFVIIEYKKSSNFSIIDQGYSYLSTMINNKADFILEYNENSDKTMRKDVVDWSASRVLFVSPSFTRYQKNSINFNDIPFELWEIRKFSDNIISLDQHLSSSKESINKLTNNRGGSIISKVSSEVRAAREEDHISHLPLAMQELWAAFREKLEDWPDNVLYTRKHYIGLKRNNKLVATIYFRKDALSINITRGEKEAGKPVNKFFNLSDDYKNMAKEYSWNNKGNGRTGHEYKIPLRTIDDIKYVIELMEQKYNSF